MFANSPEPSYRLSALGYLILVNHAIAVPRFDASIHSCTGPSVGYPPIVATAGSDLDFEVLEVFDPAKTVLHAVGSAALALLFEAQVQC
jgi:hypothetical protein